MSRKLPKSQVRDNRNTLDQKVLCVFEDIKQEILATAIAYSQWANWTVIEEIATYLRDQRQKRTAFRIPDNYINWYNEVSDVKIEKPKLNDIDKVWPEELAQMEGFAIKLWPQHLKSVEYQVNLSRWLMDERLASMIKNINLVKWVRDKEEVARILLTKQTVRAKVASLEAYFKDREITMFIDKWWKRRSTRRYSQLAVRTNLAVSYNQWLINRKIELWQNILERSEIIDERTCPICIERNWEIRDIAKQGMPPLIFHYNCRGKWRTPRGS